MMLLHGIVLGLISYVIMVVGLGQKTYIAENRSVLFAALITIYMVLFGHGLPTTLRHNL
jgi:hypothetical protein